MLIAIEQSHRAARELAGLAAELRRLHRGEETAAPHGFSLAMNLQETHHGSGSATYLILPGRADATEAIRSYQYLRSAYPAVLTLLFAAASHRAVEITIEVGTLKGAHDPGFSQHDLLRVMPRILALFRGTISPL